MSPPTTPLSSPSPWGPERMHTLPALLQASCGPLRAHLPLQPRLTRQVLNLLLFVSSLHFQGSQSATRAGHVTNVQGPLCQIRLSQSSAPAVPDSPQVGLHSTVRRHPGKLPRNNAPLGPCDISKSVSNVLQVQSKYLLSGWLENC